MERDESAATESSSLFEDWIRLVEQAHGPWLLAAKKEPGPIALRARWHYLRGLGDERALSGAHEISVEQWDDEIYTETAGDLALVQCDIPSAKKHYMRLLSMASHPVGKVQAMIGLADAARQDDDTAGARTQYEAAIQFSVSIGFQFGAMRARLPLAYLERRGKSAQLMLNIAGECEQSARTLGDRIYIANALVAQGEALDLLGRPKDATSVLSEALALFQKLKSPVGMAAAGVRLADVHRRQEDAEAILDIVPRILNATGDDCPLQESIDLWDVLSFAHLHQENYDVALAASTQGIQLANGRYPRAVAHLKMSEGAALLKLRRTGEAAQAFLAALNYFHERPDDQWMKPYCLGRLAQCAEDQGKTDQAVKLRLLAIEEMEHVRASQIRPDWQQEYRIRFDDVYGGALLTMIRSNDATSFAAVFESLWGRRLVGVKAGVALDFDADPVALAHALARQDQTSRSHRSAEHHPQDKHSPVLVDAGGALHQRYADATAQAISEAYRPVGVEEALSLLEAVNAQAVLLLVCEVPGSQTDVAWLARLPGKPAIVGLTTLSTCAADVLDVWSTVWPREETAASVEALGELIPECLRGLPVKTRVQIVPLGRLWAIPWAALPVRDGYLGTTHSILISPSLSLARQSSKRLPEALNPDAAVECSIGPDVKVHDLRGLGSVAGIARDADSAGKALEALLAGKSGTVVVVAHGRPTAALGHYLELGVDTLLTPTEMFTATPPESIALLACWGARTLETSTGDPLTLGTIALARGAKQVLTTVSELGDSVIACAVVNETLYRAKTDAWPGALRSTLAHRQPDLRQAALIDWAALTTLGAW
ncbi:CHAT domain-containing protein [Paenarthrobacter nitroguajacolicus]